MRGDAPSATIVENISIVLHDVRIDFILNTVSGDRKVHVKFSGLMLGLSFFAGEIGHCATSPIEFGGQFRTRYETTNVQSYGNSSLPGRDQLLFRTRLSAKTTTKENLGLYIELQDSRTSGSETSVVANSANVDLHQGYLDVPALWDLPLSLRVGRWGMRYGDQRLISTLEWSNVGRSWDGVRLHAGNKEVWGDFFVTNVRETANAVRDHLFYGIYTSFAKVQKHEFDFYILARDFGDGTTANDAGTRTGNLSDRTLGARAKGRTGPVDYSGEFMGQFGRRAGDTVQAWGAALTAGYTADLAWSPRLGVGYDHASGDSKPGDGQYKTFDPLFPFGHPYQGHADVVGWRNVNATMVGLRVEPRPGLKVWLRYHSFRTVHDSDAWYTVGGTPTVAAAAGLGKHVGDEIDIFLKTKFRERVNIWIGYSHFIPGGYGKSAAFVKKKNFAFAQGVINF